MRQNDEIQIFKLYVIYPTLNYQRYENGSPLPYHRSVLLGQFIKLKNSSPGYFGFGNGDLQLEQSVFFGWYTYQTGGLKHSVYVMIKHSFKSY